METVISVGLLLGFVFVRPRDIHDMHAHLSLLVDSLEVNLPELPGLDFSAVGTEWNRIRNNIPELWKINNDGREFQVGEAAKERGLSAEFPVVLIPGIVSTVCRLFSISSVFRSHHVHVWVGLRVCRVLNRGQRRQIIVPSFEKKYGVGST